MVICLPFGCHTWIWLRLSPALSVHPGKEILSTTLAYDRLNYARYLPYYFATMCRLNMDYPDMYQHFMQGGILVQIDSSNPIDKIPCDQTIKETINKDTQTAGGTKGFSL